MNDLIFKNLLPSLYTFSNIQIIAIDAFVTGLYTQHQISKTRCVVAFVKSDP